MGDCNQNGDKEETEQKVRYRLLTGTEIGSRAAGRGEAESLPPQDIKHTSVKSKLHGIFLLETSYYGTYTSSKGLPRSQTVCKVPAPYGLMIIACIKGHIGQG